MMMLICRYTIAALAVACSSTAIAQNPTTFSWVWSTPSRPPDPPREPQPVSFFNVEFTSLGSEAYGPTETREVVRFKNVLHHPGEPDSVLSEAGKPTRPYVKIGELKFGLNWYYSSNIRELINTHVPRVGGDAVLVYHAHSGGATAMDLKRGEQAYYQSIVVEVIRYTDSGLAQSESFEFKGIALGSDIAAIEGNSRYQCIDSTIPTADRVCKLRDGESETIAGTPAKFIELLFYGGKLHAIAIAFDPQNFGLVATALKEKYGEGDLKTEKVKDRTGTVFDNLTYTWRRPGAALVAKKLARRVDRSTVWFRTDFALEEFERRLKSLEKAKAKDR